jgi:hypothetical protein
MTVFGWWQGLTKETRFLGLVARVDVNYPVSCPWGGAKHSRKKFTLLTYKLSAGMLRPYQDLWFTNQKNAVK